MDKIFIKRILFIGIILASVLYIKTLLNITGTIFSYFIPLIVGGMIAFVMNVLMKLIEEKLLNKLDKPKIKRALSLISTLLIILIFLTALILMIIPEMKVTFTKAAEEMPGYISDLDNWMKETEVFGFSLSKIELDLDSIVDKGTDFISKSSDTLLKTTMGVTSSVVSIGLNTVLGLVFAIYILISKEKLCGQFNKLFRVILSEKKYNRFLEVSSLSYRTFQSFVTGQFLEALIIGVLCFIGMLIFSMPYAIVISPLVGFTALVPIFGAFIGTAIGAFLIVMVSPIKALWFVIFIIVLQQLEGNLIYPKVVGGSIGLPSIWVLAAVTIGASVYGILGMLIGVPLASIAYTLLKQYVAANDPKQT